MLQSDRLHHEATGSHYPSAASSQASSARAASASKDLADLDALLSKELSPNKKAIISALLATWGVSSKVCY